MVQTILAKIKAALTGPFAIAIGMLVDGAVVVVENIATHLAQPSPLSRLHRIYRAVREVIAPVTAGILIIIITWYILAPPLLLLNNHLYLDPFSFLVSP